MYRKIRANLQILFGLLLAMVTLLLLVMALYSYLQPLAVAAQEPPEEPDRFYPINDQLLATFGLSEDSIRAASGPFDLEIVKETNKTTVNSGESVTFNISISNHGPNPISPTLFYDDFPPEMTNVSYEFSPGSEFITNGEAKPWWLSYKPIPVGGTVEVTVTGKLESAPNVTIENTAIITVTPFHAPDEATPGNNKSTVAVDILGSNPTKFYYFPIIFKSPPIEILYSDDFSDDDSGWYKGYSGGDDCYSRYEGGRYRIDLESSDKICFRPAPAAAERTYGSFEVLAYHSEGESNAAYGIYSNGAGGDIYYLFRIWPNNGCTNGGGDWDLYRKSTRVLHGDCETAINRGLTSSAANRLKIEHTSDGTVSVFVNDTFLDSYPDSSQLTGKGTGLYLRSDNKDIVIKFDEFKVYAP